MEHKPTLLHSCARAATRAEAAFRIGYPNSTTRSSRVVALDDEAATILGSISGLPWNGTHFLTVKEAVSLEGESDAILRSLDGEGKRLSEELNGADVAVMIATAGRTSAVASIIGRACASRRIMTAGLVIGGSESDDAVTALRPYASVLVVSADSDYVASMLVALRA